MTMVGISIRVLETVLERIRYNLPPPACEWALREMCGDAVVKGVLEVRDGAGELPSGCRETSEICTRENR